MLFHVYFSQFSLLNHLGILGMSPEARSGKYMYYIWYKNALIYRKKIYSRTTISRPSKTVSVTRSILYAEHVNQILNVNYIILYCKIRSLSMILLSQSWIKGTRCVHQFQTCSLRTLFFILSIFNIFETQWLFNVNLSSRYMYTDIIQSDLLLFYWILH